MALTVDVLKTFAEKDTARQVEILRRTGMDTDAADKVLGYLAGNYTERYRALMQAIARHDNVTVAEVMAA